MDIVPSMTKLQKASAGYYSVMLTDYQIKAEATALPHSGMLRFTFPENKEARIQIDLARRVGGTSIWQTIEVVDDHTIRGRNEVSSQKVVVGAMVKERLIIPSISMPNFPVRSARMGYGQLRYRTVGNANGQMSRASGIVR